MKKALSTKLAAVLSTKIGRRVPVIRQLGSVECGAACLAMILNYFGRETSMAECRIDCAIGRDGVSAGTIARVARKFGLRVKAYSLDPSDLEYLKMPAIAHWEFNHFIVLEKWSPRAVEVVDPGVGRRSLTPEEFSRGFTGVVLSCEPGEHFRPPADKATPYWVKYVKSTLITTGAWSVVAQILLTSLLLQGLGLALPALTKTLVDQVLPFQIKNVMSILAIGMVIAVVGQTTVGYLRSLLLIYLRGRLDSQLMHNFFEHLLTLPFSFFQQRTSGDLLMRLSSNSVIREMLTNQTVSVILDGSFMVIYLLILWAISPLMGLLVIGLGAIQVLTIFGVSHRVRDLAQRDLSAKADEQSYLVEAMKGIPILKASGAEDTAFERWSNLFSKQLNISLERSNLSAVIEAVIGSIRAFSPLVLLWLGAQQVLDGTMSLGMMLALNALAASFMAPLTALVGTAQQMQMVGAQLDRIADVLDAESEQLPNASLLTPQLRGGIELRDVSFRYTAESPLVLNNISCSILPGQKVALVGPTGSGKSTLAMLLLGLYEPSHGEILYDGTLLQNLNYKSLRSQCGVVLQDTFLFSGSIRQNLALSRPDVSLPELVEIANIAVIHADIANMPMGYDTTVSEGGTTLSGGQRQRLSLARALVHKPAILVLDEATSHLDVRTESQVDRNLSRLPCTRIVIAHRLSTVRNADQILVLNEGRIIEQGLHEELMARGGYYAAMVLGQSEKEPGATISAGMFEGSAPVIATGGIADS
ncbi:MAG TPA: peptidase domain-containing ABC transporter [Blastocatellia bacterium]|nr:peptidase domain-containing ABC transporter [Blastocatellia bacterium]